MSDPRFPLGVPIREAPPPKKPEAPQPTGTPGVYRLHGKLWTNIPTRGPEKAP